MSLASDALLDRIRLKSQLSVWRGLVVLLFIALLFVLLSPGTGSNIIGEKYIARIKIEGLIVENQEILETIEALSNKDEVKAVVLHISSPGGTVVGGESIFETLKDLRAKKPLVAVMGTMATSAGYMVALPANRIYARKGTLTGSIGVLLQSVEVVDLAKKLGIDFTVIKSSPLKATPNPMEKLTPEARAEVQALIMDFHSVFKEMVQSERKLSNKELNAISNGVVFTGKQALKNKLVDAIGGEKEAIKWLKKQYNMSDSVKVKAVPLIDENKGFKELIGALSGGNSNIFDILSLEGLVSVWHDG
jgi:protease-4